MTQDQGCGDPEGRALAAIMFPAEWAYAEILTGKRRNSRMATLRRRAKAQVVIAALIDAGHSCGDCRSFVRGPESMGRVCSAHSDFHGYQLAKADEICPDWTTSKHRPTQQENER